MSTACWPRTPGLAICAVSLRTPDVRDALTPQDGLYALAEKEADPTIQVIGSIKEVLVAPEDPEAVFARLDQARYVTSTVTEKGYCLTTDGGLDLDHPDIRHDLAAPRRPVSLVGWITEALARRRAAGRAPFTTISCDNLSDNGLKLHRAVVRFAEARGEPDLARWIEATAAFPSSMVDSITPATDDALRAQVQAALGLTDAWPIQRERFVQWVVEDKLGADAPLFARAGVTVARDVAPFERAKLRLLNGAHSTLAYAGLALGHETVSAAMGDPRLAGFVERMMRQDVAPTLDAPELDVPAYIGEILTRFRNPAIVHKLSQIAWDGSQKLRFRLLETAADALAADRTPDRLAVGVAAWMQFVVRQTASGRGYRGSTGRCALQRRCDLRRLGCRRRPLPGAGRRLPRPRGRHSGLPFSGRRGLSQSRGGAPAISAAGASAPIRLTTNHTNHTNGANSPRPCVRHGLFVFVRVVRGQK